MVNFDVVNDIVITSKTIFLRCDLNVPIENGVILDDTKIVREMPMINYLVKNGARVVLGTHLGTPNGNIDEKFSTKIIADYLERRMRCKVHFSEECVGEQAKKVIFRASYGEIIVLENLAFHREEFACDLNFAQKLSDGMNVYVNDTFESSHLPFASILGVPLFVRATAGIRLAKEVENLDCIINNDDKTPIVAIIGGNRFSKHVDLIRNLVDKVQYLVLGGTIANVFLKANGYRIGKSMIEEGFTDFVFEMHEKAKKSGCNIIFPHDFVVSKNITLNTNVEIKSTDKIVSDDIIIDVGPVFINLVKDILNTKANVLWHGSMGVYEHVDIGTFDIAKYIATRSCARIKKIHSVVGGNDTVKFIKKHNLIDKFSYVSTSGNAFFEYLQGKILPGIEILHRLSSYEERKRK